MKISSLKMILIAGGLLLLSGCVSLGPKFTPVAKVPAGKALVYLYRPSQFAGSAASYLVYANKDPVTRLYNGGYYPYFASPGETRIWAKTETTASVTLDLKPGEIRYVRGGVGMGIVVARPRLTVVNNSAASTEIVGCKLLSKAKPQDNSN